MLTVRRTPATSTLASRLRLVDDLDDPARDGQAHCGRSLLAALRSRPHRGPTPSIARLSCKGLDGGGLLTFQMPVPDQREAVERHLLRDTAYEALCDAIVGGTLAPGEQLHDDELCALARAEPHAGARRARRGSRTTGSSRRAPQRFTRVTPLDAAATPTTLFPVLAALHGLATELAVPRADARRPARCARRNDDYMRAGAAGRARGLRGRRRFHGVFVDACERRDRHLLARLGRGCTG